MTNFGEILARTWNWEPSVLIGCEVLLLAYAWLQRFKPNIRWLWFILGDLFLVLALISPLDRLGDQYLFSAHMLQHLILMLVVPVLLICGLPPKLLRKWFNRWAWLGKIERTLTWPLSPWLLAMGTMWLWHIPTLYDAALYNEPVHILQHMTFLVTATVFWWPVITPLRERRMKSLWAVLYLFSAGVISTLLGIILTFIPAGTYRGYINPPDSLNLLPLLRDQWGYGPELDQQVGGILMWVLGGLFYTGASLGVLARWFSESEREDTAPPIVNGPIAGNVS